MDDELGCDSRRVKEIRAPKEVKDAQTGTKTTAGTKLKERWLLTRKTWRYMSDAGKKLFPEGVNPNKAEDVPKVEEHFQKLSQQASEYILWNPNMKPPEDQTDYEATMSDDDMGTTRYISVGDLGLTLPLEFYNQLIKNYGMSTLNKVASKLLEEQLMEEDELEYAENDDEYIEVDGKIMRSVGTQTDPYLDMCVQTDHDDTVEDYVKVGAETRAETEAAVAKERASMQEAYYRETGEKVETTDQYKPQIIGLHPQQQQQQQLTQQQLLQQSLGSSSLQHQQLQQQSSQQQSQTSQLSEFSVKHSSQHSRQEKQIPLQPDQQEFKHQQHSQPPVLKKFWARRESISKSENQNLQQSTLIEKERDGPLPKGGVAAKLASLKASSGASSPDSPVPPTKPESKHSEVTRPPPQVQPTQVQPKQKKSQNEFKLGLRCDLEDQQGITRKISEKSQMDKFKTVNYDKTLRNIKSKWVPNAEEEAFLRQLQKDTEDERERLRELKVKEKERIKLQEREEKLREKEKAKEKEREKEKEKEKKKKKARSIQVGEPLPQFILNSLRINSPVEIIHATRKRLRRLSSKAESTGSESSMPPSGMISPKFPVSVLDEQGTRELLVSEAEAFKLSEMGIPFVFKRPPTDMQFESHEFDPTGLFRDASPVGAFPRSLSAIQASGHISQILCNLRSGRFGSKNERSLSQSLLQYLLPAVMQKSRTSGSGHTSRLVGKRIWRTRSKSQSRASAGTTSIWTPMVSRTLLVVLKKKLPRGKNQFAHLTIDEH